MTAPANPPSKSAGRALIWLLLALAATLGVGIPIYRAASLGSTLVSVQRFEKRLSNDSIVRRHYETIRHHLFYDET